MNTIATAVALALCTVPVGWLLREVVAEVALRRLYDRPVHHRADARNVIERRTAPALPPVSPLAAGRFVVDAEVTR